MGILPVVEDVVTAPRYAVLSPSMANFVLVQLARAGWGSARWRGQAETWRYVGRRDLAEALEEGLAQLKDSAAQHRAGPAVDEGGGAPTVSDDGNGQTEIVGDGASSGHEELTTLAAAAVLGVSARRVAQLVAGGALVGRKVGRAWLVERGSVEDLHELRRSA